MGGCGRAAARSGRSAAAAHRRWPELCRRQSAQRHILYPHQAAAARDSGQRRRRRCRKPRSGRRQRQNGRSGCLCHPKRNGAARFLQRTARDCGRPTGEIPDGISDQRPLPYFSRASAWCIVRRVFRAAGPRHSHSRRRGQRLPLSASGPAPWRRASAPSAAPAKAARAAGCDYTISLRRVGSSAK